MSWVALAGVIPRDDASCATVLAMSSLADAPCSPIAALFVALAGCGPGLIVGGQGAEGTGTGGDTGTSPAPPAAVEDDGVPEPGEAEVDDGVAEETGFAETGEPPDTSLCWQVQPMFEGPTDLGIVVADQDTDGREELWLVFDADSGPGPGDTLVFAVDAAGVPVSETLLSGFMAALGDIEGDGLLDLVTVTFGMGMPFFGFASANGPATFDVPPLPLELQLQQNTSGFFDINGDGPADVFLFSPEGALTLLLGNGGGAFEAVDEVALGPFDGVSAMPIDGLPDHAALLTIRDFQGGEAECTEYGYQLIAVADSGLDVLSVSEEAPDVAYGRPAAMESFGGGEMILLHVASCDPGSETHDIRTLVWDEGTDSIVEQFGIVGQAWVSVGDFDGDGQTDAVYEQPGADGMEFLSAILGDDPAVLTDIEHVTVPDNRVWVLDMDGNGRDELIRAVEADVAIPGEVRYERVFLDACNTD